MAILRRCFLESEILAHQVHYDRLFRVQQVSDETEKKAMQIVLDGILREIESARKEIEDINRINNL